jgi:hypothetical protein
LTDRAAALDEIESAHGAVSGTGAGRRIAMQQINQSYTVLLSAHFQAFCRELHTESADHVGGGVSEPNLRFLFRSGLLVG